MEDREKLSVIGLGKLGCSMLASFALKGWEVVGYDIVAENVRMINEWKSPVYEPLVNELIHENHSRITATSDIEEAIRKSLVSFVIVPTPSLADGSFSLELVRNAIRSIGDSLRLKNEWHLVVVTSTVLPGDMIKLQELLEEISEKKCGIDFGLCYNPDFIALGSVVRDFLNPDMVLIGESDKRSGDLLESIHRRLVNGNPNIHRMNFQNAELSKIALNSYCTLKITFANKLAELCENIPGGNAEAVCKAIGDDQRVGKKYFRGGLSYGGPCFPRDNRALAQAASRFGVEMPLAVTTDLINDQLKNHTMPDKILSLLQSRASQKVAVLGCTYKKNTTLVEESAIIAIIKQLCRHGIDVSLYDPAGMENAKRELFGLNKINFASSVPACLYGRDLLLIGCDWDEFKTLSNEFLEGKLNPEAIIVDACNCLSSPYSQKLSYITPGKNEI